MNTPQRFVIQQNEVGEDVIVGPFENETEAIDYARRLRERARHETAYRLVVGKPAPIMLDTNKARVLLHEIVNSPEFGPDYVYNRGEDGTGSCVNWQWCPNDTDDGEGGTYEPACLIGQLWFRLGFDRTVIPETSGSTTVLELLVHAGLLAVPEGDPLESYLSEIQQRQDSGTPWGKCLVEGEHRLVIMLGHSDSWFQQNEPGNQGVSVQAVTREAVTNAAEGAYEPVEQTV
jgi:hypothetical protein